MEDAAPMTEAVICDAHDVPLAEVLRRFDTEATRGVCDTGRYRCPYFSWGRGPALVMIPGLSDDARSFVLLAARLMGRFRCIAYDLPTGCDDGARMRRYTHADLVDDLRALLDHLGIQQTYLLGGSFGSTIVLGALLAFPERFPRAVLQGGFARRRLAPAEVGLAWLARFWPGPIRNMPLRRAALTRSHAEPFAGREPAVWDYFLTRWGTPPIAAVARRALLLHQVDLRSELPRIKQPVLLVCGDRDPLVNPTCESELLQGLPDVDRVELPGCGHNPQFTHPEVFAELLSRFLSPTAGSLVTPEDQPA
jgi:pimeloyl-ACP methyl ester carboxylesterase